jgi:hypothetical protein
VKDYYKMRPEGFEAKDVFVCESRYSIKQKAFKKIKVSAFLADRKVGWGLHFLNFSQKTSVTVSKIYRLLFYHYQYMYTETLNFAWRL